MSSLSSHAARSEEEIEQPDPTAALRSKIRRAVMLARAGHLHRAAQTIERPPLPQLTNERIAHLLSLFPPRSKDPVLPNTDTCVTPVVEPAMLRKLIVVHDQGKSPGPSCLTLAHLRSITSDADCCAGLAAMVQDVVDGNLTPAAADIICRGVSIGTDKGPMQVRPLTMPESIYKLAALFCLNSMDYAIPTLFPRIQLGVGIKGGPEIAIHRTQLALERGGPGTVVLRTDFRNAFNERDRAIIARALHGAPLTSGLWRFFMMAYGRRASHLGIYNRGQLIEHFLNSQGVRQGCPLASFLYALSVQPLYEQCVEGLSDVEAYAVADDLTLVGPARSVLAAARLSYPRLPVLRSTCTSARLCGRTAPTMNHTTSSPTQCKSMV